MVVRIKKKKKTSPTPRSIEISGSFSKSRRINHVPKINKPIGKIYPPQPKRRVRNKIQLPINAPLLTDIKPKRVTRPTSAITTPAISSLRSKERLDQKDDTGTWPGVTLPAAFDQLELPRVDLRARELVFPKKGARLLVFPRAGLLRPDDDRVVFLEVVLVFFR